MVNVMSLRNLVLRLICILVPCKNGQDFKDAVWRPPTSSSRECSNKKERSSSPTVRTRKRWASSPKSTPGAVGPFSPQITPIERLMVSIRSLAKIPSISDADAAMPEMSYFSRILSTLQVSTIFHSLSPRARLNPWTLLFSLSRDGCSLKNLYNRLSFFDCTLLLVIQVGLTFIVIYSNSFALNFFAGHSPAHFWRDPFTAKHQTAGKQIFGFR